MKNIKTYNKFVDSVNESNGNIQYGLKFQTIIPGSEPRKYEDHEEFFKDKSERDDSYYNWKSGRYLHNSSSVPLYDVLKVFKDDLGIHVEED